MLNKKNKGKTFRYDELQGENESIVNEMRKLEKLIPDAQTQAKFASLREKFKDFSKQCSVFDSSMSTSLNKSKMRAERFLQSIESQRSISDKLHKKKNRIKSQEIVINTQEREWQLSLGKIKGLWQKNLNVMESSIHNQKAALQRIGTQYFNTISHIEREIQDVIEGPKVPNLYLENIAKSKTSSKPSSARSSCSHKLSDEEEIISNRSAFSFFAEEINSHRSNSSRPRPPQLKRQNPPLPPALPSPSINISYVSDENESLEFDKIMLELEKERIHKENSENISMEKTIGGWKSEYESEGDISMNHNPDEIKRALMILKKARLLNAGGNQFLLKLAEMIKEPENSSNVELMLQLIDIERTKNKASQRLYSRSRAIGKPPTPTNAVILRKRVPTELVGTSREKFMFSEEKSFDRTILSIENHLSPKGNDFLDEDFVDAEMNDVNIEDLLNVSSIIDGLGLISADNSIIQEENEKSRVSNYKNIREDHLKNISSGNSQKKKLVAKKRKNTNKKMPLIS